MSEQPPVKTTMLEVTVNLPMPEVQVVLAALAEMPLKKAINPFLRIREALEKQTNKEPANEVSV